MTLKSNNNSTFELRKSYLHTQILHDKKISNGRIAIPIPIALKYPEIAKRIPFTRFGTLMKIYLASEKMSFQ